MILEYQGRALSVIFTESKPEPEVNYPGELTILSVWYEYKGVKREISRLIDLDYVELEIYQEKRMFA